MSLERGELAHNYTLTDRKYQFQPGEIHLQRVAFLENLPPLT